MFNLSWSRRKVLKGALFGAAFLLRGLPALAETAGYGTLPEGRLSFYNIHSRERLAVTYRDLFGNYDAAAMEAINNILRCRYTGKSASMDVQVIEYLNLIDKNLGGGNDIHVVSGYRSPELNALLGRESRGVAKSSLHTKGRAIDIMIPGIATDTLREYAYSLACGGVGYYPREGFVHIDSGGFRIWSGS
ncbi:DUF882 domain-containing protein [Geomonas sp. RF6]|uniref:YcbK family protein n=1 Tax=Geomonas sp. RF6 TaxID=2897342 RepID=UPI001E451536|nr:DUF882 domain-containing protein [Geomonas sp. RF6]UFS69876.1 DUF882 domain-containing protein [Geomonas sp. RF6]